MRILHTFLALLLSLSIAHSQELNDEIAKELLQHVNTLRDSLGLSKLKQDNALNEAGLDHAFYINQKGKLTHFQKTFSKETPSERVLYYKGNRTYVGENVASVSVEWKSKNVLDASKIADALFDAWLNSPKHYENMISDLYTKMGLGVSRGDKLVYAAQVFSSNEIRLPSAFRNSDFAWGVRPGEFTCKDDEQVYETMFFANYVECQGREIYMVFHDLNFFRNVIANDNDGLAIDVVLREQLPCGKENQFHISKVFDGEMQRPIYKNDIFRNNLSSNPKKIRVKIGEVPSYLGNKQWDANVIIINDNILCDYSVPISVPSDIYPLLDIKPYFELSNEKIPELKKIHIHDSIHVTLDYERSRGQFSALDAEEFQKLLRWGYFANDVKVDCFTSVEGKKWYNLKLLEKREESVMKLLEQNFIWPENVEINKSENWEEMQAQIEVLNFEELKGKSEGEIKYHFKKNPSKLYDSLLFEQRKTHVYAVIDTLIDASSYENYQLANYYGESVDLSELPWNKLLYEEYIKPEIPVEPDLFDSLYKNDALRVNLLAAGAIEYANDYFDSTSVENFVKDVDQNNKKELFNYAHFLTTYWYAKFARSFELKGVAKTISPEKLWRMLGDAEASESDMEKLTRLKVNTLLSGIHYYVAEDHWSLVNGYFDQIENLVKADYFDAQEAVELALFCNHFHKFKQAINILDPFFELNELDENGLFILAETSTLWRARLNTERYHQYMEAAKKANKKRYCKWLNDEFQIQRDEFLKKDFCATCR